MSVQRVGGRTARDRIKYRGDMGGELKPGGLATAIALAGGIGGAAEAGQVDMFADADDAPMPLSAAAVDRSAGRPKGARNRSTEQWRQFFLGRFASPLMVLGELYSRSPADLARELNLYKRGKVWVSGPGDEGAWVEREDPKQLDLEAAIRLQIEAATAVLPYVHQKQPIAVETKQPVRGLLVIGDLSSDWDGEALPLADPIEENQRVIDVTPGQSDGSKSEISHNHGVDDETI